MSITTITPSRRLAATVLGTFAVALGALGLTAPAANVGTIQQSCDNPDAYAAGAVTGVYSTARRGNDRDQICKVYDANGKAAEHLHQHRLRLVPQAQPHPAGHAATGQELVAAAGRPVWRLLPALPPATMMKTFNALARRTGDP